MPGMMDTILNLGLNDETVKALGAKTNNVRFALDSYRRFIHMFGATVMGITAHAFSDHLEKTKKNKMVSSDTDLDA
jgi:pyruvate,orthophosphate dikinase